MGTIKLLDEQIANQIAAGEVVERPSSVVKELVENAIDAKASTIDVTIEEGGLQLIRVKDNGTGMAVDDCELAFQRHATSKISTGKDLFSIRTLGFRGEALPSIAAVSKLECVTSSTNDGLGRKLVIHGGTIQEVKETAASRGTEFAIRELFYNTPARLKYMKTVQTELGHVSDYMYRMALANPEIAFTLKHNDHILLQTQGNGDMLQAIAAIYGTSVGRQMIRIEGESLDYTVNGYIAKPEITRANRNGMTFIINGRYVRSYSLHAAAIQGYHTLLPINRYPVVVLHIQMDPALIDVNVHPAKLEVRFSKEQELTEFVTSLIKAGFQQKVLIPEGPTPAVKNQVSYVQEQFVLSRPESQARDDRSAGRSMPREQSGMENNPINMESRPSGGSSFGQDYWQDSRTNRISETSGTNGGSSGLNGRTSGETSAGSSRINAGNYGGKSDGIGGRVGSGEYSETNSRSGGAWGTANHEYRAGLPRTAPKGTMGGVAEETMQFFTAPVSAEIPAFPVLSPIGQLHGTYLLAQNESGLFLIDQHAAHERMNYEYYLEKFGRPEQASQEIGVPVTLEFTPAEAERLSGKLPMLEQVGVYLESFGGNAFIVRAYPHWFPEGEEQAIIEEMCEWILSEKQGIDVAKLREKSAIMVSCKASIKANQSQTIAEMEALLDRLGRCRNPYTCPHGRPIIVSFSTYELEKMFKRVM